MKGSIYLVIILLLTQYLWLIGCGNDSTESRLCNSNSKNCQNETKPSSKSVLTSTVQTERAIEGARQGTIDSRLVNLATEFKYEMTIRGVEVDLTTIHIKILPVLHIYVAECYVQSRYVRVREDLLAQSNLKRVLFHELGHCALGLRHIGEVGDLMNEGVYKDDKDEVSKQDLDELSQLVGVYENLYHTETQLSTDK